MQRILDDSMKLADLQLIERKKKVQLFICIHNRGCVGMGSSSLTEPDNLQKGVLEPFNFWEYPRETRYFSTFVG